MPAPIALLVCTCFVLFLLRLDHRNHSHTSPALWIPTAWLCLTASKPLAVWFSVSDSGTMVDGSIVDRLTLILLFVLGIITVARRNYNWRAILKNNPWIPVLLLYTFISIVWSDMPYVSLKRWFRTLIPVVMCMVVASEKRPLEALDSIMRRLIYILIPFSYLLIHYFPQYGRQYHRWTGELMWLGASTHKNGLAFICSFTVIYLLWMYLIKRKFEKIAVAKHQMYLDLVIFLLAIWLFMGPNHTPTYSATSVIVLTLGIISLFFLLWLHRRDIKLMHHLFVIVISAIIIYGTITPFIGQLTIFDPSSLVNRSETLTGRTDIWQYLIPYALNNPVLGSGFGGFWTDEIREATSSHAHNGYLDVILNTGLLGLFLWSLFLLSNARQSQQLLAANFPLGTLWFSILLVSVVHNIVESTNISFEGVTPAILLLFMITTANYRATGSRMT